MEGLETAQVIWDTATKAFDNIDNEEKKEWFNNLIDQIEENKSITKLKDIRNTMTEEQKLKLYKKDANDIGHFVLSRSPIYCIARSEKNVIINTKNNWFKHASKYALLEQIPCRFLVQLCILDKPEKLTDTQLSKDIKKDAKNMNTYLWVAKAACTVIPGAQEALPLIWIAKHYIKRYKKEWADYVIERLNSKKESDIKAQTNKELFIAMSDITDQSKAA